MGLRIIFCLLSYGLATVVQLLNPFQVSTKNTMTTQTSFPATGHVGLDATNWYLHAWIMTRLYDFVDICLLSVSSNDSIKLCILSGTVFEIRIADTPYTITGATFRPSKWFFIEIGSTNLGYYASVQQRNGTPIIFPQTGSPLTLKETSSIKYPDLPYPPNYEVRAT
jgi:hypothetical protein